MKSIGRDGEVFNYLIRNEMYILSSLLLRIDIFTENYALVIELHFKLRYPADKLLKIRLVDVLEYGFYYNKNHFFYNVERFKFFQKDDNFYISLDPHDETEEMSKLDQDFVMCKSVEAFAD